MSTTRMQEMRENVLFVQHEIEEILNSGKYPEEILEVVRKENLLPAGLLNRLQAAYPAYSAFRNKALFTIQDKKQYSGLKGFREILARLEENGIYIGHYEERELFIKVYRFMATRHVLNAINWDNFAEDSIFQLVFPQPGMIRRDVASAYLNAGNDEEKLRIVKEYIRETNPHDGKQQLNKPSFINDEGELKIVEGSQHKYPQCQLIFDIQTQNCFAFCNYCFRHAQVRGDEDMFLQRDIGQIHHYLRRHPEVTDVLITGGDGGYISAERFDAYVRPVMEDPALGHIKTIRLGTRILTFNPEIILMPDYQRMLDIFRELTDNGIQMVLMSHFSTPRELMNPLTVAAIRRLRAHGVTLKSQSPIMNYISLYTDENGVVDIDRSAQNWIDLGNLLAMLGVGFHSMYMARPTGEHHYFTQPLAVVNEVFSKVYRSLSSINRPSRYITMTSSAGKISMLGTLELHGEKLFALKFNEARNMEWMDKVYLARYDETENTIANLKPYGSDRHFFEAELEQIESKLEQTIELTRSKKA